MDIRKKVAKLIYDAIAACTKTTGQQCPHNRLDRALKTNPGTGSEATWMCTTKAGLRCYRKRVPEINCKAFDQQRYIYNSYIIRLWHYIQILHVSNL